MRIATLLIATFSLLRTVPCSANSNFFSQNSAKNLYSLDCSWLIAENHDSINELDSKITLFQQLSLTVEQRKKIKRIHRLHYPEMIRLKEEIVVVKEELTTMMASTESATTIRTKHQQILDLKQELGKLQLETMLKTREILTLEQRQNFADILRSR